MKIYKLLLIVIVLNVFTSCEKFLDVKPSKTSSLVPTTIEHLESLLNNYSTFAKEGANELVYGTDDFGLLTDLYDAKASIYATVIAEYATWDKDYLADYDRPYWPAEWKKIFIANLVLGNIAKVSGDEATKNRIEAEAHFIRAYSYFQLANVFCLPYTEANKEELGLPLKQVTSFEESVARASLEDTWAFIEADLTKALELSASLVVVNGQNRTWRASTAAVKAFAARYYLSLHDYANAQMYAEQALAAHSQLRDYNTGMRYSDILSQTTIFPTDGSGPITVTFDYPYTHDNQSVPTDMLEWEESYYYRYLYTGWWYYIPSPELLGLYDQTYDLRYKYHMVENYSYDRGLTNPAYEYPGYIFFFKDKILNGPSVPEMILTKAECQIRQGSWQAGLSTANQLRAVRMDATAPADIVDLSATSQNDALAKVLAERRREMPFTTRWFDVRRFNNNNEPSDDVIMTRSFYPYNENAILVGEPVTYTLEKNSRRFANPIPNTDILSSNGVLQQNQY